jgi:predicted DsbA family dithiol-disulfide isomerase
MTTDVAARPKTIEMYADVSCPFAHVGLRRLVAARDARGSTARIRVRAWPLEWINGRQLAPELVTAEIAAIRTSVAPDLFAGFDPNHFPESTIGALGLAAAAYRRSSELGERLSLRLREALFEEGRDLDDAVQLRDLAHEFGLEPSSPSEAEGLVRADWERGQVRGVRGSPHFFVGTHNWFCPSLSIRHVGSEFDISVDAGGIDEFYATALG